MIVHLLSFWALFSISSFKTATTTKIVLLTFIDSKTTITKMTTRNWTLHINTRTLEGRFLKNKRKLFGYRQIA